MTIVLARLTRDRLGLAGLCMVAALVTLSIVAPMITSQDPSAIDATRRLEYASHVHPLGTDNLGRDVLSRLLYGSRWSLGTVAIATMLILSIGVTMGIVAGYVAGLPKTPTASTGLKPGRTSKVAFTQPWALR